MKKLLIAITVLLSTQLIAMEGIVQLHIDQFGSRYQTYENHPVLKELSRGSAPDIFQRSKLFLRLKEEFKAVNKEHNFFTPAQLKKLPETPFDLFLYNIQTLDYLVRLTLDQPQFLTMTNLKLDTLKTEEIEGVQIYQRGNLFFGFNEENLCLSGKKGRVASCLKKPERFTLKSKESGYPDLINVDVQRIWGSTPYLNVYWFQQNKELFKEISDATIYFKLEKKALNEYGVLRLNKKPDEIAIDGVAVLKDGITLFNRQGGFQSPLFNQYQGVNFYQRILRPAKDTLQQVMVGTLSDTLDGVKKELMKHHPRGIWEKSGDHITFKYGLMNRKTIFMKQINKTLIVTEDKSVIKGIKKLVQSQNIIEINATGKELKQVAKILDRWNKQSTRRNYSYGQFLDGFLSRYLTAMSSFQFIVKPERDRYTYTTKIKF